MSWQYSDEREGTFKLLRDLLNKYPDSRCAKSSGCMSTMMQRNSRTVYGLVRTWGSDEWIKLNEIVYWMLDAETNGRIFLYFTKPYEYALDAVITDHKQSGRCNLQLAKKGFFFIINALMLPKGTLYRKSISIGWVIRFLIFLLDIKK